MRPLRNCRVKLCRVAIAAAAIGLAGCAGSGSNDAPTNPSRRYEGAPPPAVIAGVRLGGRVSRLVRRACRQAQREARIRVVCPGWVPQGPLITIDGLWGPIVEDPDLWLITFNNGDNGPRYLHWMMGAGRKQAVQRYLLSDTVNAIKGLPKRIGGETLDGRELMTYRYPAYPAGGPNGGHVAVYVSCGRNYVFASLHGFKRRLAARALALAYADQSGCSR
jgi:hypothetical protein